MFYFNTQQRVALYRHEFTGEGIDHCYDCACEVTGGGRRMPADTSPPDRPLCALLWPLSPQVALLKDYLTRVRGVRTPAELAAQVAELSRQLSRACASNRTLAHGNSDPDERKKGIIQRYELCAAARALSLASVHFVCFPVGGSSAWRHARVEIESPPQPWFRQWIDSVPAYLVAQKQWGSQEVQELTVGSLPANIGRKPGLGMGWEAELEAEERPRRRLGLKLNPKAASFEPQARHSDGTVHSTGSSGLAPPP